MSDAAFRLWDKRRGRAWRCRGGTPYPGCFVERVWICLIAKELSFSERQRVRKNVSTKVLERLRVAGLGCFGEEQPEILEERTRIAFSENTSRKRIQLRRRGGLVAGSSRLTISGVVRRDNWSEGGLRGRWSMETMSRLSWNWRSVPPLR